jgi:outer membrane protein
MRRFATLAALALLVATAGTLEAQQVLKIGYLDSGAVLRETPGAAEAQAQFQQDLQQIQAQIDAQVQTMQQEIETAITQYQAQQATMTDAARQQKEQEITAMQAQYQQALQQLNAQAETQAGERQQQLVQPIMDRINSVVDALRTEGGYSLIFDLSAGAVLAADPALDLTSEVIRRLQAEAPPASPGGAN